MSNSGSGEASPQFVLVYLPRCEYDCLGKFMYITQFEDLYYIIYHFFVWFTLNFDVMELGLGVDYSTQ